MPVFMESEGPDKASATYDEWQNMDLQSIGAVGNTQVNEPNIALGLIQVEPEALGEGVKVPDVGPSLLSCLAPVRETKDHIDLKTIPSFVPGFEQPEFEITTSPTNIYLLRKFHKKEDGTRGEYSCCMPNFPYLDYATSVQLPQYIYRATSDASGGHTSKGHFKSKAMVNGMGATDWFAFNNTEMRAMIERHENGSWFKENHWISFTDSLATVIGRALKYEREGKKSVQVHVLDTYSILKPALMVWAYAVMKAYKACERYSPIRYKLLIGSAINEFLVWDELHAEGSFVALKDLKHPGKKLGLKVRPGLLKLMPRLKVESESEDGKTGWRTLSPREIQDRFYGIEDEMMAAKELGRGILGKEVKVKDLRAPIARHNIDEYALMAGHFDIEFRLPMLMGFLSMRTRVFTWKSIVEELTEYAYCHGYCIPEHYTFFDTGLTTPARIDVFYFRGIRPGRNLIGMSDKEGFKKFRPAAYLWDMLQSLKRKLAAYQSCPVPVDGDTELFFAHDGEEIVEDSRASKRARMEDAMIRDNVTESANIRSNVAGTSMATNGITGSSAPESDTIGAAWTQQDMIGADLLEENMVHEEWLEDWANMDTFPETN